MPGAAVFAVCSQSDGKAPTILPVSGLIERDVETSTIDEAIAGALSGAGRVLMLSGVAGVGKSALIGHAVDTAATVGLTTLTSCPTPVSPGLAHGVVRDWLGPLARRHKPGEKPFDGPAERLGVALTETGDDHPAWSLAAIDYALAWLIDNLADRAPVLLVVDDVQWADSGSLQLLDLLSARVARTPVVLLVSRREGEPSVNPEILDRITHRATEIRPAPLSVIGVEQVRRDLSTTPAMRSMSSREIHRLTGGVPFLVRELLRGGGTRPGSAPQPVVDSLADRLGRLGDRAMEIARTVAVLGDEATFDGIAELSGLNVADLSDPLETLTDAGIVTLGTWRASPAHPIVAEAVLSSMTPSERSDRHRRAADHLTRLNKPRQVVASHLVHTLPREDPTVVDLLRKAGEDSLESGATQTAATQLYRAVSETRPEDTDPCLVTLAATAHMRAGLSDLAFELWQLALGRITSAEDRAACLADMGDAQMTSGDRAGARASYEQASRLLTEAGHDASSPELRTLMVRMSMVRALYDGAYADLEMALGKAVTQAAADDNYADRQLFAIAASALATRGEDTASARSLAVRALADGKLIEEDTCDGKLFYVAAAVLDWSDAYEDAEAALDAAIRDSRRRGSPMGFATASYSRGRLNLRRGRLQEAVADLDAALQLRARGWSEYVSPALASLVLTYLGLGRLDAARALEPELRQIGAGRDFLSSFALHAAGIVRTLHGDHERALADFRSVAEVLEPHVVNPAIMPWRELSAYSLMALGRRDEAREHADEAVALARQWGAPRSVGWALRTQAQLLPPDEAVPQLREAVRLFESCQSLYYLARAKNDLGELLLGSDVTRDEGVELLRCALEYGRTNEVPPVARRASQLLLRNGIRVADLADSPLSSLTPGERRVVELAATGHTNRAIARQLFVTVKAVEWHLSNAYRKLGVSSRAQLPDVLADVLGDESSSAR